MRLPAFVDHDLTVEPTGRSSEIARTQDPADVLYVERREYGPFIGLPVALRDGDRTLEDAVVEAKRIGFGPIKINAVAVKNLVEPDIVPLARR